MLELVFYFFLRVLTEPLISSRLNDKETTTTGQTASAFGMDIDVGNVPGHIKQKMFKDAHSILEDESNIVPVPGSNRTEYYVLDISTNKEKRVKINATTSRATCDSKSCHNWNSFKLCSHIIALAEKLNLLKSVLEKYNNKTQPINVTSMVNTNMPASRGKKGTKSTQIRKGQSNKPETIINNYSNSQRKEGTYNDLKQESAKETMSEPFELTFIQGLIKKCYGCGAIFSDKEREKPYDIIIKHLEIRPNFDKINRTWYIPELKGKSNAYYHLRTNCVQSVHKQFSMQQLTVPLNIQMGLSDDHKRVIQLSGFNVDT